MQRISMLAMLGLLGAMACGSSSGGIETKDTFDGGPGGGSTGRGGSSSSTAGSGGDGGSSSGGSIGSSGAGGGGSTGNSGGGSTSTGGGLTAHEACKQNIAAHCERTLRCKGADWLSAIGYTSVEDCATRVAEEACTAVSDFCTLDQIYHPDKAQACVDAVKDLECSVETSPAVCDEACTSSSGGESPAPGA